MLPALQLLASLIEAEKPRILDLGCGPGNLTTAIADLLPNALITAVDFAPDMCRLAKAQLPNAHILEHDIRLINSVNLPPFDVILCGFCIPYLNPSELSSLISNSESLLLNDGLLLLSFMEGAPKDSGYVKPSSGKGKGIYTHYYQESQVNKLLSDHKLNLIRSFHLEQLNSSKQNQSTHRDLAILAQKKAPQ